MGASDIEYGVAEPGFVKLTLNRPHARNAYTSASIRECTAAVEQFARDDAARVLIITGAGDAFCAGGDIKHPELGEGRELGHAMIMREGFHAFARAMRRLDKPVVAMINGAAMAGGLAIALLCDIRIASDRSRFGDPSGSVGLSPDEGGAWLFPRAMGLERALRMTLLGETYDAMAAERLGLVSEVVPHSALEDRAFEVARQLAGRAPLAVRLAKRMMVQAQESTIAAALDYAELAVMISNESEDALEGMRAFAERRPPRFLGR
jgi:2-(1,2-epoxy-1,2-dihydrophenyl)acetyl-CoA isomerase